MSAGLKKLLEGLLPNDTNVWKEWRDAVKGYLINDDPIPEGQVGLLEELLEDTRDGLRLFNDHYVKGYVLQLCSERPL